MFPSGAQTQVMLQLSGDMDLRVNTAGRERRYQTRPGHLSLTSAHLPDFEMAWQSLSSAPIRLLELCLDNELLAHTAAADAGLDAARLELHDGSGMNDPLLRAPNLIVVPHIGSATHEAREQMTELSVDNLLAALNGDPMPNQINRP